MRTQTRVVAKSVCVWCGTEGETQTITITMYKPFLSGKKREQIDVCADYYACLTRRTGNES
jgi:hypothetical protein